MSVCLFRGGVGEIFFFLQFVCRFVRGRVSVSLVCCYDFQSGQGKVSVSAPAAGWLFV